MKNIHTEISGHGSTAIVFVHGWLGNSRWWDAQRDELQKDHTVVLMDLPGHGQSLPSNAPYSSTVYAEAIQFVANNVLAQEIVLVGHSMSGAYVLEAAPHIPKLKKIIIVDTLKNMEQLPTPEQAEEFMFTHYRADYASAVKTMLPRFLFSPETPSAVKERLTQEFLQVEGKTAIELLAPLYHMDVQSFAQKVTVPVVAINSDYGPNHPEINKKYFNDYSMEEIKGTGHYPMLEKPSAFTRILKNHLPNR